MSLRKIRNALWILRLVETKHKDNVIQFPDGTHRKTASFMMQPNGQLVRAPRRHPVLVLIVRCIWAGIVAMVVLTLGACSGEFTSSQRAAGVYEVRWKDVPWPDTYGMVGIARRLDDHSLELCPAGYDKLLEHRDSMPDGDVTIWQIRCVP